MKKKTILVIEGEEASGAAITRILREHGLRLTTLSASHRSPGTDENAHEIMDLVVVSRKEAALRKLIWHHLTNLARNLLGPITTWSDIAGNVDLISLYGLQEFVPLMKQAVEQLYKALVALHTMDGVGEAMPCNLLEAIRQAENSYKASLLDSNISLTVDVAGHSEVNLPAYLVSLVVATVIDNAQDAILAAEGRAGREIRIESRECNGEIICHIANSGAIDEKDVPHLFKQRYSTKPHGQGVGLLLAVECLAIYNAELALISAGPPETVFSLKLEKAPILPEKLPAALNKGEQT